MNDILSSVELKEIQFEEVLSIWERHLWPNRTSPIKPMSSMTYDGDHDMSIYSKFKPTFFGAYHNNQLIGVNSGHRTDRDYYRSRGLYVCTDYRQNGIATLLLTTTIDQARKENCKFVWTCPRLVSMKAYKKAGFRQVSSWDYSMEFGPNCYCIKDL